MSLATGGIELAVVVAGGYFGGAWLDGRFGTEPVWTVALSLLGAAAGMFLFIRQALRVGQASGPGAGTKGGRS